MTDKYNLDIENDIIYIQNERNANAGVWIDKDGNKIKIKNMSIKYIKNCINYINKGNVLLDCYIGAFEYELKQRGE